MKVGDKTGNISFASPVFMRFFVILQQIKSWRYKVYKSFMQNIGR